MKKSELIIAAIVEESYFTPEQVAVQCAVEQDWVLQHLEEGLLSATKQQNGDCRFSVEELARAKRIVMIERNFDAFPELAVLVADMQEEIDQLRQRLRRFSNR